MIDVYECDNFFHEVKDEIFYSKPKLNRKFHLSQYKDICTIA